MYLTKLLGNPSGIATQCGTVNAWEYNIFSDYCYTEGGSTTSTYCIVPSQTNYNLTSIDAENPTYTYLFSIQISTPYGNMESNLSSSRLTSNVILNGQVVGTAMVSSVSDTFQPPLQEFINGGKGYVAVNSTSYSTYMQALGSLHSTLDYYNGSSVSGDVQSEIQQAVTYYEKEDSEITSATTSNNTGCTFFKRAYRCNSSFPFSYVINVTLSGYTNIGKQTLYWRHNNKYKRELI